MLFLMKNTRSYDYKSHSFSLQKSIHLDYKSRKLWQGKGISKMKESLR